MNSNIFIDNLKKVRSGKYDKIMPIYLHLNMFDNDEKMGLPKYKYSQTCQKIHGMHTHNTLENYCRRGIFLKRPLILFNIEFFLRERERGRERFSIFFFKFYMFHDFRISMKSSITNLTFTWSTLKVFHTHTSRHSHIQYLQA
jgi:hypothetical protein